MKKLYLISATLLLIISSCTIKKESLQLSELKTEYSKDPVCIDLPTPRFSWMLEDTMRNVYQESYQIFVATNPRLLKPGKADLWESGVILSSQSIFIDYKGKELQSSTQYFWKVIIRDNHNRKVGSKFRELRIYS